MRRFLLGFMVFLMLTPVLACAMTFCPMQAAKAVAIKMHDNMDAMAAVTPMPPCHNIGKQDAPDEQSVQSSSSDHQQKGIMFALDCMGVDLFSQTLQADLSHIDWNIDKIHFSWVDLAPAYDLAAADQHFIRGPPFDDYIPLYQNDNLYLITQRIRA